MRMTSFVFSYTAYVLITGVLQMSLEYLIVAGVTCHRHVEQNY